MKTIPDRLSQALDYAMKGWHVFPLVGKRPATPRGWKDATTDPHEVASLWAGTTLNVGIATGDSGLLVVDLDGPEALEWWDGQASPETASVRTARGRHLYFHGVGRSTVGRLAPGVDTRGLGGYVVAPPSQHPDGSLYLWEEPHREVQEAPGWLLEAVRPVAAWRRPVYTWGAEVTPSGALRMMQAEVRAAQRGYRNEALNRAAWRARGFVDPAEAVPALLTVAHEVGLGWMESVRTTASGLGLGVDEVLAIVDRRST